MTTKPKYTVEILGNEVRRRRLELALSREQLATKSGVSFSRITKIEGGIAGGVSTHTVNKLCDFFGCKPQEISVVIETEVAS